MNTQEWSALVSGAFVFWNAGETLHDRLHSKLERIGLAEFCPKRNSANECLKKAMSEYGNQWLKEQGKQKMQKEDDGSKYKCSIVIKGHYDTEKEGYECGLYEHRQGKHNDYTPIFSAKVTGPMDSIEVTKGYAPTSQLEQTFWEHRQLVSGGAVGQSLVNLLNHFHGTCVRAVGGVYYLPDDAVQQWDDVCEAFESASKGKTEISRVRVVLDEKAALTVRRAITKELVTAAGEIASELAEGNLQEKGIETRRARAEQLRKKALRYQSILQQELIEAMSVIEAAELAAGATKAVEDSNNVFDQMFA